MYATLLVYLCFEGTAFIPCLIDLKEFKRTLHSAFDREELKFFKNVLETEKHAVKKFMNEAFQ